MDSKEDGRRTGHGASCLCVLLFAGLVLTGACEGENYFTGDVSEYVPRVESLSLPQVAFAGEQIAIRVDATATRGVSQVVLSMRGAVQKDTVVDLARPKSRISQVVNVMVPQAVTDTLVWVTASVIDQVGESSYDAEGVIAVFGPPTVSNVLAPSIVEPGSLISIRVSAISARNISQLDIVTSGAMQTDTSVAVTPARTNVVQDIVLVVPSQVQDTVIHLAVSARDQLGGVSTANTTLLPLVIAPPTVAAIVPPTVQAGKVLSVAVSASSLRRISEIRLEVRGGFTHDKVVKLSPARANVQEYIDIALPSSLVIPELRVRAVAVDRASVLTSTAVFNITAPQFAPTISSVTPFWDTIEAGHYADFRVEASGDRPINRLRIRWRGFSTEVAATLNQDNKVLPGPESAFDITPPRLSVVEDVAVETPCVRSDAVFYALVTAYDEELNLSPIVMSSVYLTGNAVCDNPVDEVVADTTAAPRVHQGLPSGVLKGRTSLNDRQDFPAGRLGSNRGPPVAMISERRRKASGRARGSATR